MGFFKEMFSNMDDVVFGYINTDDDKKIKKLMIENMELKRQLEARKIKSIEADFKLLK